MAKELPSPWRERFPAIYSCSMSGWAAAVKKLESTAFYQPRALLEDLLRKHGEDGGRHG